jgi:hypothetical protein
MRSRHGNHKRTTSKRRQGNVEIREDLQDAARGKDLSYLNEMPQMGGYEGVKAGVPPPRRKNKHKTIHVRNKK